ncbi:MAG: FKBP-type peptidyl-prolyl cis-trans isomerase [Cryomorphaceae bacterium]|nr:FKBP-type peptidyl-prolyl cis-trans isomerase [Flavobacteriales bacterium]
MPRCTTIFVWLAFASALLLAGCQESESYREAGFGSKWRLLSFQNSDAQVDTAALVYIEGLIAQCSSQDTVAYFYNRPFEPGKDELWQVLRSRYAGDSIEYLSAHRDFLHPPNLRGDTLCYQLKIDRIRTAEDLKSDKFKELMLLDSLVRTDSIRNNYREFEGIYLRHLAQGDTSRPVEEGGELVIHYRGSRFNGEVFDDSRRMNAPLRFVMGNENQVLPGLEKALYQMNRGGKTRVIMPSWLAFGSRGSAAGHVMPYTPVVYELEVREVAR